MCTLWWHLPEIENEQRCYQTNCSFAIPLAMLGQYNSACVLVSHHTPLQRSRESRSMRYYGVLIILSDYLVCFLINLKSLWLSGQRLVMVCVARDACWDSLLSEVYSYVVYCKCGPSGETKCSRGRRNSYMNWKSFKVVTESPYRDMPRERYVPLHRSWNQRTHARVHSIRSTGFAFHLAHLR